MQQVQVYSVDDLAKLKVSSIDDLAKIGIKNKNDLAKLGINSSDLKKLGIDPKVFEGSRQADERLTSLTKEQLKGKPKNSPNPDKWFKRNGSISESSTWHHYQDGVTLQEVLTKLHERFRHRGGMSKIKK